MVFQSFKNFYRIILVIFLTNADELIHSSQYLSYIGNVWVLSQWRMKQKNDTNGVDRYTPNTDVKWERQ